MSRLLPILGLVLTLLFGGPVLAEPRVALVIGNSSYGGDLGDLPNPANDAKLMAKTLKGIGFEVIEAEDADQAKMKRAIQDFGATLANAGAEATGLFFYAGHGLQVAGTNYLIPINAKIEREGDVDIEAVPVDLVMKQMAFAGSAVNIVILDACRNNPLSRGFRAITKGLADPTVRPEGSFIAYSTAPGDVADDGHGTNSPFTKALAESITQPGASINDVFQDVRGKVRTATNKKQVPWDSSSLTAPFYFVPAAQAPAPSAATDVDSAELAFWNAIKDSKSPEDYQAYLEKFPDGVFAPLAKLRAKPSEQTAARVVYVAPAPAAPEHSGAAAIESAFWASVEDDPSTETYQAYLGKYPNGAFADLARQRLKALDAAPKAATEQQAAVTPPAPKAPPPEIVATTAKLYAKDKARLREAPTADAAIIVRLAANTALEATGRSADGAWWRVTAADGKAGFVAAGAVTDQAPAPAATPAPAAPVAKAPEPEVTANVPAGQEQQICLKGADRPSAERVVACRRYLAAGISDATDRYNADLMLADALFTLGKNDEAMTAYRAAVDVDPKFFSAYDGIGSIHMAAGRYAEARSAFDKAVSLNGDDPGSLYQRSTALTNLGAFDDARADLKRAIAIKSDDTSYFDQLGVVDMALGDLDSAVADVDRAVAIDPNYWGGTGILVTYLAGKPERTIAMVEAGMKDQPSYPYFYIWKSLALKSRGDEAGATAALADGVKAIGNKDWPIPLIDFLAGRIPESRLRALAASSNAKTQSERVCEIDFYRGELAYLAGDKAAAKAAYQAATGSRIYHYLELAAAQARLGQLNQ